MKTGLLALLAALTLSNANAQELAWEVDAVDTTYPFAGAERALATPDGGVVTIAFVGSTPTTVDSLIRVSRYDENGDRIWNDVFPARNPNQGVLAIVGPSFDAAVDPQGDLYLLARTSSARTELHRIAPDGTRLWSEVLLAPSTYRGEAVAVAPNGQVLVAGTFEETTLFPLISVRAFDPFGNEVWRWDGSVGGGGPYAAVGDVRGMRVAPTGDILIYGASDTDPYPYDPLTWALDATGSYLWRDSSYSGGAFRTAAVAPNGDWVLAAGVFGSTSPNTVITRYTPSGTQLYDTPLGGSVHIADIEVDAADTTFYAASIGPWIPSTHLTLGRLDAAGNELPRIRPSVLPHSPANSTASGLHIDGSTILLVGSRNGDAVVASFRPDGTERWSLLRSSATTGGSTSFEGADVTIDPRGNTYLLATGSDSAANITKLVEGGSIGTAYCSPATPNSTGVPASLTALGDDARATDNVTLRATDLPSGAFTLFLASRTQGMAPGAGGSQGTLCLGGAIGRYVAPGQIRRADGSGSASLQLDLDTIPQPTGLVSGIVGERWYFQAWYRDANPGITSNLTDAVAVALR